MSKIDFDNLSYAEAREIKEILEGLFDSPAWKFIKDFLEERAQGRLNELVSMCPETVEQMVRFARVKGSIDEIVMLPVILAQVLSDVTEAVRRAQDDQMEMELEDGQ